MHWLPGETNDDISLARALFLERRYWKHHEVAIANGIAKAFRGN